MTLVLAMLMALHGANVRFHHVHYRTADPAAAMADAATRLHAVRAIVSGLGVGVKTADTYLLFDRLKEDEAGEPGVLFDHLAFAASDFDAAVTRLASVHRVLERRDDSVLFDAGGMRIEIVRETESADLFWCPMHPDVKAASTGKCPICAMDLVPIPPLRIGEYKLDLRPQRGRRSGLSAIRLTVREPEMNARVTACLTLTLSDAESGAPITNLEPFLGAPAHMLMVRADLSDAVHAHPEEIGTPGPTVTFHPLIPADGVYKIWVQIQRGGKVTTAPFLVTSGR